MKKIPVTVQVPMPETLDEAIAMYGIDAVYKDYIRSLYIEMTQRMHAAGKIHYSK